MRRKFIAGNWKMNATAKEAVLLVKELAQLVKDVKEKDIIVCPPFTALQAVKDALKGANISLGCQNMLNEDKGAFTGEISPIMIKEFCTYVIIGHSERRQYFHETNLLVNKKIQKALEHGLLPILCVGEKLEERESGRTNHVLGDQITDALSKLPKNDMLKITIAYEPVWAIGTGKTAMPEQAEESHAFIRQLIRKLYDSDVSEKIRIIYGGSVKASNAQSLLSRKEIDGALVGGASLDAKEFAKIVKA